VPDESSIADWGFLIPRRCPECKHSLAGLTSPRCTECGRQLCAEWLAASTRQAALRDLPEYAWPWRPFTGPGEAAVYSAIGACIFGFPLFFFLRFVGVPYPLNLVVAATIGVALFSWLLWRVRRSGQTAAQTYTSDLQTGMIEIARATGIEAVTLRFPAGAVATSPATLLFVKLESGSILVLDEQHLERLGMHDGSELRSEVEIGWLPDSGHVVHLRVSGPSIPVGVSRANPQTIDHLGPGVWVPDDLFFEISFDSKSPTLFGETLDDHTS